MLVATIVNQASQKLIKWSQPAAQLLLIITDGTDFSNEKISLKAGASGGKDAECCISLNALQLAELSQMTEGSFKSNEIMIDFTTDGTDYQLENGEEFCLDLENLNNTKTYEVYFVPAGGKSRNMMKYSDRVIVVGSNQMPYTPTAADLHMYVQKATVTKVKIIDTDGLNREYAPKELDALARGTNDIVRFRIDGVWDNTDITFGSLNGWFFGLKNIRQIVVYTDASATHTSIVASSL